jgi:WD40 repeat protein
MARRYALVVGISEYSTGLPKLSKTATDAKAIATLLNASGSFQQVTPLIGEVNNKELIKELRRILIDQAEGNDALIYIAGHGISVLDPVQGKPKIFLAPSDCVIKHEKAQVIEQQKGIPLESINALIKESRLSSLVMLLDSCHSGGALQRNLLEDSSTAFSQRDYYLITACREFENAYAFVKASSSIFTEAVLQGLSQENADEEGKVSAARLFDYVSRQLRGGEQEALHFGSGGAITITTYLPQFTEPTTSLPPDNPSNKKKEKSWLMNIFVIVVLLLSLALAGTTILRWQQAMVGRVQVLSSTAATLLVSNRGLDAIVEALKAGNQMRWIIFPEESLESQVTEILQKTVYEVRERNRLEKHQSGITSVDFSSNGEMLVSASEDGEINLWNLNGEKINFGKDPSSLVFSANLSPDGKKMISAGTDKTIKLWRTDRPWKTDRQDFKIVGSHDDWIKSAKFSPNGQRIASAGLDNIVKLWDLDGQELIQSVKHGSTINSISFSPDSNLITSASKDGRVRVWNLDNNKSQAFKKDDHGWVLSVSFSPDGKLIASAHRDGTIKLWSLDGQELKSWKGHSGRAYDVKFDPHGKTLASGGRDGTVKLWNLDGQELYTFKGHTNEVKSVSFSADGKTLASGSLDNTVRLWSVNGQEIDTFRGHSNQISSISFKPDGEVIASGDRSGEIKFWNLDGREMKGFSTLDDDIYSISFSPSGRTISFAGTYLNFDSSNVNLRKSVIRSWNIENQEIKSFGEQFSSLISIGYSPDGTKIVAAGSNKSVELWNISRETFDTFPQHSDWIQSVTFSPNGNRIASASDDGTIRVWSLDGRELLRLPLPSEQNYKFHDVQFSPDGKYIAGATREGIIKVWDLLNVQNVLSLNGHKLGVFSISFSPDSKVIASGSLDKTVRLWDFLAGKELIVFKGHTDEVRSVKFSPNGKIIASGSNDKTVKLWSTKVLSFDELMINGCSLVNDYLKEHPDVLREIPDLCTDISQYKRPNP